MTARNSAICADCLVKVSSADRASRSTRNVQLAARDGALVAASGVVIPAAIGRILARDRVRSAVVGRPPEIANGIGNDLRGHLRRQPKIELDRPVDRHDGGVGQPLVGAEIHHHRLGERGEVAGAARHQPGRCELPDVGPVGARGRDSGSWLP